MVRGRVLQLQAVCRRYRPLKVKTVAAQLQARGRLGKALRRLRQFFPQALAAYPGQVEHLVWYAVLGDLLWHIDQADWFPLDWPAVNRAWAQALEQGEAGWEQLARYLDYIPVRLFGIARQDVPVANCPATLELLRAMLFEFDGPRHLSAELAFQGDLFQRLTCWTERERQAAWQQLARIEADPDPGRYFGFVRQLPALGRWACSRSGNLILDQVIEPDMPTTWIAWDDEAKLARLRQDWPRARQLVAVGEQLEQWYSRDMTNLTRLADFLAGEIDRSFDWNL